MALCQIESHNLKVGAAHHPICRTRIIGMLLMVQRTVIFFQDEL